MNKKYVVKQTGYKNCAAACLLSIIRYNGGNISVSELEYIIKTNENGTNAYDLIEGAKTLGFDGMGKKIAFERLVNEQNITPFIAHVRSEYGYHYVCVYKIDKKHKTLEIMDPAVGYVKETFDIFQKRYLGVILILKQVKQMPNLNEKNEFLSFIISRIIEKKKSLITISLISILVTFLSILINYNLKINIDSISKVTNPKLFLITLFIFVIIVLLKNILSLIREKIIRDVEFSLNESINHKLIHHLFNIPYNLFYSRPTGEIVSRINDLEYLKNFIQDLFLNIFVDIFIIIISLIGLLFLNVRLSFITLMCMIMYLFVSLLYKRIYKRMILNVQIYSSSYQTELIESINSYESINNLNIRDKIISDIDNKYYKTIKANKTLKKVISSESFIKNLLVDLNYIIVVNYGLILLYSGSITLGEIVGFTSIMTLFISPLRDLIDSMIHYVYSLNSYNRINDFLLIKENNYKKTKEKINGDISFKNICYETTHPLLNNLSFNIKEKEKIFLNGKSGSGKSTLLKILKKYITDYKGNIYINDMNLKDINPEVIANSILYVSQNEHIFTKSIKENILLDRIVSNKKYNHVKNITLVNKILDSKPYRDEEIIEEDGFNLSGGEKQKIILARALLNDFNILILDEALSEVDTSDEATIINNILKEYSDKTFIYVSHKNNVRNLFKREINLKEENE